MKVFLSWSGEKSRAAASAFQRFLRRVIQGVDPWMSDKDIAAGARWAIEVGRELEQAKFGILFVTSTNFKEPWLLFEAGALGKTVEGTFVCPYLIDLKPEDIPSSPLTQYQYKASSKEGTLALLNSLNSALERYSKPLSNDVLLDAFNSYWPELERAFQDLLTAEAAVPSPSRPPGEILAEILNLVRDLASKGVRRVPVKDLTSEELLEASKEWLERESFERVLEYYKHDSHIPDIIA